MTPATRAQLAPLVSRRALLEQYSECLEGLHFVLQIARRALKCFRSLNIAGCLLGAPRQTRLTESGHSAGTWVLYYFFALETNTDDTRARSGAFLRVFIVAVPASVRWGVCRSEGVLSLALCVCQCVCVCVCVCEGGWRWWWWMCECERACVCPASVLV